MIDLAMADSRAHQTLTIDLPDEAATARLGQRLAGQLKAGDVVALSGGLGSGKTALARTVIRSFMPDEEVPSPSFTLVQTYPTSKFMIWHVDLYRLENERDAVELGLDEALDAAVLLIEWPDRVTGWLPKSRLEIALSLGVQPNARTATLSGFGGWEARVAALGGKS